MSATAVSDDRQQVKPIHVLANGGVVVVVGGRDTNFAPEHRTDARLVFWDTNGDGGHAEERPLPANCRAAMILRFVSHRISNHVLKQVRARGLTIFYPSGTGEARTILDQILAGATPKPVATPPPAPVPSPSPSPSPATNTINLVERLRESLPAEKRQYAPRGGVKLLVETHYDPHKPLADERTRLLELARAQGMMTTTASVEQTIRRYRRDRGLSGTPACLQPKAAPVDAALATLDDAIAGLQLIRETIASNLAQGAVHRQMVETMREALAIAIR